MAQPPKERKLDVFEALGAIDRRDGDWLSRKPEDAQKEFAPPVMLRWASSVGDGQIGEYYLRAVNDRANLHMWDIAGQHPELVFKLLASCGIGRQQRHAWIPMIGRKKGAGGKARELVARLNPTCSDKEVDLLLSLFTPETFIEFVRGAGLTPQEEKETLKSYGTVDPEGSVEKPKGKAKGRKAKV